MKTQPAASTTVFRAVLVLLSPCTIAACSSHAPVVNPTPATTTCHASQLGFGVDSRNGQFNGMSHSGTMLTVRNTGSAACTLPAQPQPVLTNADKRPLDIITQPPTAPAPSPIRLAPGAAVESEMRWVSGNVYEDGHCESPALIDLAIGGKKVSTAFTGHLCGAGGKPTTYTLTPFRAVAAPVLSYACDDGRKVQASYPDTATAVVTLDGNTHHLHIAISADGARYVGDHWQWWTKGMHDAWLSPLRNGETYPSASGVACHAP
ncbi:MliC family protein [Rhodanobacter sp. Root480]|uniref:MliC family protein n=1 Tax=Rhodanobacter sp. Root480 TaxID=1736542 RepID=UPI000AA97096|nr:MliC family protein [Rhodanobacter sp. Root480]